MKLTEKRVKDAKRLLSAMLPSDNSDVFIIRCPNCGSREGIEFVSSITDNNRTVGIYLQCGYCRDKISIHIDNMSNENGNFKVLSINPKL